MRPTLDAVTTAGADPGAERTARAVLAALGPLTVLTVVTPGEDHRPSGSLAGTP
jgi:hypothetical protein